MRRLMSSHFLRERPRPEVLDRAHGRAVLEHERRAPRHEVFDVSLCPCLRFRFRFDLIWGEFWEGLEEVGGAVR